MRSRFFVALAGATVLCAPAAFAQKTYDISKVTITGNKSVSTDQLMAVIKEHPGQHATVADILADRDAISKVLEADHVQGSVSPKIVTKAGKSEVIFAITDEGVHTLAPTTVAPKLHAEIFVGNKLISTDKLVAASGLTPGEELSADKLKAAEQGIAEAYKQSPVPVGITIAGANTRRDDGTYDITWTIVEKRKHRPAGSDKDPN